MAISDDEILFVGIVIELRIAFFSFGFSVGTK